MGTPRGGDTRAKAEGLRGAAVEEGHRTCAKVQWWSKFGEFERQERGLPG